MWLLLLPVLALVLLLVLSLSQLILTEIRLLSIVLQSRESLQNRTGVSIYSQPVCTHLTLHPSSWIWPRKYYPLISLSFNWWTSSMASLLWISSDGELHCLLIEPQLVLPIHSLSLVFNDVGQALRQSNDVLSPMEAMRDFGFEDTIGTNPLPSSTLLLTVSRFLTFRSRLRLCVCLAWNSYAPKGTSTFLTPFCPHT